MRTAVGRDKVTDSYSIGSKSLKMALKDYY
jgi:hypothetical protein